MESQSLRTVVRKLRQVVAPLEPFGPDAELVRAFVRRRDPSAFEQIVRRHGPMVLGVCRRVLRDPADADDAFQATFLVLLRRAGSLRQPDRLAGWLHGVANRTARKLRAIRMARMTRETELFDMAAHESPAEMVWRELRPIFDHELDRLPEKLRLPAVLCFLEGHSKSDAARALGWPEGTLSGRLQRARERLRIRFAARGLTLTSGALAMALFEGVGSAAVTERLVTSTLQLAATGSAGAAASAGAWALADGVSQAMFVTKLKTLAAGLLVAGVLGTGTGVVLVPGSGPVEVVAGEQAKDGSQKSAPPAKEGQAYDFKEGRKRIDTAGWDLALFQIDRLKSNQNLATAREKLLTALAEHVKSLRDEAERVRPLVTRGTVKQAELDQILAELRAAEKQLEKETPKPAKDPERAALEAELDILKDRATFEERMIKKGFMTESQVKKTRVEILRVEAALAKMDAPKAPDPRRAAMEATVRTLETIVEKTRDGVRRSIIPEAELLNAEATLALYKFKLVELTHAPMADASKASAAKRAALEELNRKMEEIVAKTRDGVRRNIVPQQELLNAEQRVLEYKLKLAELTEPPTAKRAALEEAIRKMEQIVEQTRDGVRRSIVPEQELLNAERRVLEYKFKLAELIEPPAADAPKAPDPRRAVLESAIAKQEELIQKVQDGVAKGIVPLDELVNAQLKLHEFKLKLLDLPGDAPDNARAKAAAAAERQAIIAIKERELTQAEENPLRRRVVSAEEIAQLRIDLARLKADAATAAGDYPASVKLREAVVVELEAIAALARVRVERKTASQSELRTLEAAVAEAKVEALRASVRQQLAQLVSLREQDARDAKKLFEAQAISAEELRKAELALSEAKVRLAEGR